MATKSVKTSGRRSVAKSDVLLNLSLPRIVLVGNIIPAVILLLFVFHTTIYDFEASTWTHCRVPNILPSLSAVSRAHQFGGGVTTLLHMPFRVIIAKYYYGYYRALVQERMSAAIKIAIIFYLQEGATAFTMSLYAESSGYSVLHVSQAISVWVSGMGHIWTTVLLYKYFRQSPLKPNQLKSLQMKKRCLKWYFLGTMFMWPWFVVHNTKCVPYAYSVFSGMEFILIGLTFAYHSTAYYDFEGIRVLYSRKKGFHLMKADKIE